VVRKKRGSERRPPDSKDDWARTWNTARDHIGSWRRARQREDGSGKQQRVGKVVDPLHLDCRTLNHRDKQKHHDSEQQAGPADSNSGGDAQGREVIHRRLGLPDLNQLHQKKAAD
jgi:hypothetical protein